MTTPHFFVEEHQILSALFDEGLEILHLRKPNTEPVYSERLLQLIPDSYLNKIVVHDHFYLKNEYGLKGIHLNNRNPDIPSKYKGQISKSFHSIDDLMQEKRNFDYLFLSPVFDSISKSDYKSTFSLSKLKEMSKSRIIDKKVFAMGGIDIDNIPLLKDLGFGGIVILGAIWNRFDIHQASDFKDLISHFRKLRKLSE